MGTINLGLSTATQNKIQKTASFTDLNLGKEAYTIRCFLIWDRDVWNSGFGVLRAEIHKSVFFSFIYTFFLYKHKCFVNSVLSESFCLHIITFIQFLISTTIIKPLIKQIPGQKISHFFLSFIFNVNLSISAQSESLSLLLSPDPWDPTSRSCCKLQTLGIKCYTLKIFFGNRK